MCLVQLNEATLRPGNEEDAKRLAMPADSSIKSHTPFVWFHAQSFNGFETKVMSVYSGLYHRVNCEVAMKSAKIDSSKYLLNSMLKKSASSRSQDVMGLLQYIKVMGIISYDASDKRRLWKRNNEGLLGRARVKANAFFFPNVKIRRRLWPPVLPLSTVIRVVDGALRVETISLDAGEPEMRQWRPIIKH